MEKRSTNVDRRTRLESAAPQAVITGGNGDLAQILKQELLTLGWQVLSPSRTELDVTNPLSIQTFFAAIPRIDYLVCAAGITKDAPLSKLSSANWDQVIATNLKGSRHCVEAAWPALQQSAGMVAFIGSHAGKLGTAGQAAYAAAKAGLEGLLQETAALGGAHNIKANLVLPGFLETKMTNKVSTKRQTLICNQHLLKRFNTVTSAAKFLAFLPQLKHTSGQIFTLDSRTPESINH